ncbi:MAG: TetR/AcrR family transcriptional regulator C-terminal domain-containing protein [Eubacteriales bacterium]|nr:TetR/AcrR family transcriptional regulator C-terminal domain-containing protein [Eubacteriales bacterium]
MNNLTKRMIKEAFFEMLRQKPIDKITVKGIVEHCEINRQTFYYHFSDIYDLMQWSLVDELAKFRVDNPVDEDAWLEQIRQLFQFIHENKKLVLHAYDPVNRIYYDRFLREQISPVVRRRVDSSPQAERIPEDKKEFICNAVTIAVAGFIFQWVEEGVPDEYQVRLDDYITLFRGSVEHLISQFE